MLDQGGSAYWGVWPPQRQGVNPDYRYALTDGVGTLPYNPQTGGYEPMQTQVTSLTYATNGSYDALPSPSYHTSTSLVGNSSDETAATANDPYVTRQLDQRWQLPMIATSPHNVDQISAYPQGAGESSVHQVQSPHMAIKPDPQQSPTRAVATRTREITPILAPDAPQSDNLVNNILRVIQSKTNITSVTNELDGLSVTDKEGVEDKPLDRPAMSLLAKGRSDLPNTRDAFKISKKAGQRRANPNPQRQHRCEFVGCNKIFAQKAQLKCHMRSHTGEKPYVCLYGCGRAFSQTGNRSTHHRGHTGEAPFECYICGKRFNNGGNLPPHIKTHSGVKEFICKLDNCGLEISTKGNLKTHQTKYHSATLEALARRINEAKDLGSVSEEDRKMSDYLASVHNNLNKGIKGCVGRKIRCVTSSPESTHPSTPASMGPYNNNFYEPFTGHLQPFQQIPPMDLNNGYGYPTPYILSRQNITPQAAIHVDIRMYDSDIDNFNGSVASPASMASPSSTATYDDEEEQRLVRGHRMF